MNTKATSQTVGVILAVAIVAILAMAIAGFIYSFGGLSFLENRNFA